MWYKEKLVAVEVMRIHRQQDFETVANWVRSSGGAFTYDKMLAAEDMTGLLVTPNNITEVKIGDYVIRQPEGTFLAYGPDEFAILYDPIE